MRDIGTQEIETDRLLLRRFTLNDTYAMYNNWAGDEEVTSHLPWNSHKSMEETGRYILQVCQTYQNPDFYHWAIALKEKEQAIGFLQAEIEKNTDCARLSFGLGRQWWNKGYMKEAVGAVVPYLFEKVQAERISACCEGNNRTAGKVLLRCGLQGEGRLRRAWCGKKGITDLLCYGLLRSDYLRLKSMQTLDIGSLYITNYREAGGLPLMNIMRLPEEEAFAFAGKLAEKTTSKNNRYGDYFARYYQKRKATEEWLYEKVCQGGGKPKNRHPIYFVLGEDPGFQTFYGTADSIRIPLRDIAADEISFTPRDSMHLKDMGMTEGIVWNKTAFLDMIEKSGKRVGEYIFSLPGFYGNPGSYIEVQLWNDDYLDAYINSNESTKEE